MSNYSEYLDARKQAIDDRGLAELKEERRKQRNASKYEEEYLQRPIPDCVGIMQQLSSEPGTKMVGSLIDAAKEIPWSESWAQAFTKQQEEIQRHRQQEMIARAYAQPVTPADYKSVIDPYSQPNIQRGKRATQVIMDEVPNITPEQAMAIMKQTGYTVLEVDPSEYDPTYTGLDGIVPKQEEFDELDQIR